MNEKVDRLLELIVEQRKAGLTADDDANYGRGSNAASSRSLSRKAKRTKSSSASKSPGAGRKTTPKEGAPGKPQRTTTFSEGGKDSRDSSSARSTTTREKLKSVSRSLSTPLAAKIMTVTGSRKLKLADYFIAEGDEEGENADSDRSGITRRLELRTTGNEIVVSEQKDSDLVVHAESEDEEDEVHAESENPYP